MSTYCCVIGDTGTGALPALIEKLDRVMLVDNTGRFEDEVIELTTHDVTEPSVSFVIEDKRPYWRRFGKSKYA